MPISNGYHPKGDMCLACAYQHELFVENEDENECNSLPFHEYKKLGDGEVVCERYKKSKTDTSRYFTKSKVPDVWSFNG